MNQLRIWRSIAVFAAMTSIPLSAGEPNTDLRDHRTLSGKVMVGYQGWFNCEGDGMDLGWTHWARNRKRMFGPANVTVDLWPDMTELDDGKPRNHQDQRYLPTTLTFFTGPFSSDRLHPAVVA